MAAGAVGSSLTGCRGGRGERALLCRETDSRRPRTQTKQNPHLCLFTEGRQDHGKDTVSLVESIISNSF